MLFSFKPTILLALALTAVASPIANPTADETNTLVARAQMKDVNCNGKKFAKQDIYNAIQQARKVQTAKDNHETGYAKYPEENFNFEGLFKVSTTLYEYPLVAGGVYSGKLGVNPDKYRVVMNEKYGYVGSLYHITGNSFKKCDNIETSPTTTTTTTTTKTTTTATAKATTKASSGKSGHKSGSNTHKKGGKMFRQWIGRANSVGIAHGGKGAPITSGVGMVMELSSS
ncbi:guanyl-specific ribonuclease Po1 [Aspergillus awamori]|uniref:Guanyl-specific ribonuclease Po1 n=1 Tax=Aspergillus awamori TaxID=105351 RepID=A0A401KPH6_ASPAW|nr:guanyl-specific ribonuclease Po1 [Aspergillus awamori]